MRTSSIFAVLAVFCLFAGQAPAQEPPQRVVASSYGYAADDSTAALQAAIDSGAKTVVVDKQPGAWIVKTITLRSDLEIILEEGVEIVAKKGDFHALGDVLLRAEGVKNLVIRGEGAGATLRMNKRDYWNEPYRRSEWRHGISLLSAENVLLENLTIAETGGDGIYLGTSGAAKTPCRNISIRRVECVENNRQGISVINVDGLLIEDSVLRDTNGTAPEAGIDFEPNTADEQITNVVMRRVIAINNVGGGFVFYLPQLRSRGHELSFLIEDCASVRNAGPGFALTVANGADKRLDGEMIVRNTRLLGNRIGVAIRSKWADGAPLRFENLELVTPAADRADTSEQYPDMSPSPELEKKLQEKIVTETTADSAISLIATGPDGESNGGMTFQNVTIVDADPDFDLSKPILMLRDASAGFVGFEKLEGKIVWRALNPAQSVEMTLDQESLAEAYPALFARRVAAFPIDSLNSPANQELSRELVEAWQGRADSKTTPLRRRGDARYYLYASANVPVNATFRQRTIGTYQPQPVAVTIVAPDGSEEKLEPTLAIEDPLVVNVDPKVEGWYRIDADFGPSTLELVDASALVLNAAEPKIDAFSTTGQFQFYVPQNANDLGLRVVGSAAERVSATLFNPDGEEVANLSNVDQLAVWALPVDDDGAPQAPKAGFWTLQIDKPTVAAFEDFIFSIQGAPALLK